ncbi:MAG: hypothetical protein WKF83_11110 [Nocardioidaceae bacterium]
MTQIAHAGQTDGGGFVAFDIRWDGDLSGASSVRWVAKVTSPEGDGCVELGYEQVGGRFDSQYVLDASTGKRQAVEENADLGDGEITVRFPADVVGVAATWPTWTAMIAVDGTDAAEHVIPKTT